MAKRVFSDHTVHDFDEESLEEGAMWEEYGAKKRGVWRGAGKREELARRKSHERPLTLMPGNQAQRKKAMVSVAVETTKAGSSGTRLWKGVYMTDMAVCTEGSLELERDPVGKKDTGGQCIQRKVDTEVSVEDEQVVIALGKRKSNRCSEMLKAFQEPQRRQLDL
ncbi:hypothetical protein NDU88_006265 [Pleurodeles waltl]|uniref:Uncharacterized protein n=1 Tax=Pleurodeles waltl TaxID=8319 RepID=A0AAV7N1U8_PLEWA|nr:hypothetical protein NDU88_006265 [Pleurodeles waltl]